MLLQNATRSREHQQCTPTAAPMPDIVLLATSHEIHSASGGSATSSTLTAPFLVMMHQLQQQLQRDSLRSPSIFEHSSTAYWPPAFSSMTLPHALSFIDLASTYGHSRFLEYGASFHMTAHSSILPSCAPLTSPFSAYLVVAVLHFLLLTKVL